ncbi:MAG: type II toxin-antitoxin system PemK/MazF family toxin [Nocardioides sp.]
MSSDSTAQQPPPNQPPVDQNGSDQLGPDRYGYAPAPDGEPDPGEIVWAWVPFEDDPAQGKDRPVLVIRRLPAGNDRSDNYGADNLGADGDWLGLPLTSKDHDRDAADEARWGRHWMDIGSGPWDPRGRPSEVRLDHAVVLHRDAIRREGAALDPAIFAAVLGAAQALR